MTGHDDKWPEKPAEPCHHMVNLVNGLVDGSLNGPAKLYTKFHVATCPMCKAAVEELGTLRERLKDMESGEEPSELPAETHNHIHVAMDDMDTKRA
jgi:anti-sigma factor RsiW